jgi:hypothetical protein
MNRTINITFDTITYQSLDQWYNLFGFKFYRQVLYLVFIPICLIGVVLNILTFIVFKKRDFAEIPVYEYLRFYTINSGLICLLLSTEFMNVCRNFFSFSNSEWVVRYWGNFFIPVVQALSLYESLLDILLSIDRLILFTNGFNFYKQLKPRLVGLLLLVLSFVLMSYYWINYSHQIVEIHLNKTEVFFLHLTAISKVSSVIGINITNIIADVIPICIEIPLNIATIYLLRQYLAKKKKMCTSNVSVGLIKKKIITSKTANANGVKKIKTMELKLTVLVIFMSFVSTL